MNSVQMQLPQKMFGVRNHQILEGPLGFPKTKQRKGGLCSQSTGTQVGGQNQRGQSYPGILGGSWLSARGGGATQEGLDS